MNIRAMDNAEVVAAIITYVAWPAWGILWIVLSGGGKKAIRQESVSAQLLHVIPLVIAVLLLFSPLLSAPLPAQTLVPRAPWMVFAGAFLVLAGMGFTVWARLTLASNWSGLVELKQEHELVRRGPYRMVRHPIYTGLLTALLGNLIAIDTWPVLLAFAIVMLSFLRKIRREEAFMRAQFGADYATYEATTPALMPGLRF